MQGRAKALTSTGQQSDETARAREEGTGLEGTGRTREAPLYLTVKEAARYAGIGEGTMRDYVASADPPPMLLVGRKRYLQRDGLERYLEERQTWHYERKTR